MSWFVADSITIQVKVRKLMIFIFFSEIINKFIIIYAINRKSQINRMMLLASWLYEFFLNKINEIKVSRKIVGITANNLIVPAVLIFSILIGSIIIGLKNSGRYCFILIFKLKMFIKNTLPLIKLNRLYNPSCFNQD